VAVSVVEAVEAELAELKVSGALAACALAMASEIDGNTSATSKSMCAKVLVDVMQRLRADAPPVPIKDPVDELRQRRQKRVSAQH
jgi:hypothetical protein